MSKAKLDVDEQANSGKRAKLDEGGDAAFQPISLEALLHGSPDESAHVEEEDQAADEGTLVVDMGPEPVDPDEIMADGPMKDVWCLWLCVGCSCCGRFAYPHHPICA